MDAALFDALEFRIEALLKEYAELKQENCLLQEENRKLVQEREGFKARIDAILGKLEGI
jgi:cell division protein ZapB